MLNAQKSLVKKIRGDEMGALGTRGGERAT